MNIFSEWFPKGKKKKNEFLIYLDVVYWASPGGQL